MDKTYIIDIIGGSADPSDFSFTALYGSANPSDFLGPSNDSPSNDSPSNDSGPSYDQSPYDSGSYDSGPSYNPGPNDSGPYDSGPSYDLGPSNQSSSSYYNSSSTKNSHLSLLKFEKKKEHHHKQENYQALLKIPEKPQKKTFLSPLIGKQTAQQFYKNQMIHHLGIQQDRVVVKIYINEGSLNYRWIDHIYNAIKQINEAAPGLKLQKSTHSQSKIVIKGSTKEQTCWTRGNIKNVSSGQRVKIVLCQDWSEYRMGRTSKHQLMHALGVKHQHQRKDRNKFVQVKSLSNQYTAQYQGLTAFDPYSIMLYSFEDEEMSKKDGVDIWKLKKDNCENRELSQLDKLTLNLLYKPCTVQQYYQPKKSLNGSTKLIYCGRKVMDHHNYPSKSMTDGRCGPNNGANCPACRVLINHGLKSQLGHKRWQGWSGMIYCGKYFGKVSLGHDGYCGPDNGPSCPQCQQLIS